MLSQLFETLVEHAKAGMRPKVIHPSAEPAHVYLLAKADGSLERREADPKPRDHKPMDLDTIARLAENYSGVESLLPVAWYSRSGVTLLADDETRRDAAAMVLRTSPQLATLEGMESKPYRRQQRDMVNLLRVSLAGCMGRCPTLVEILRRLKFLKNEQGASAISQGKSSIGRSLVAEVTGGSDIPEEITFDVPVWAGHPWRADVTCSLDADPSSESFQIIPLAGQIEAAFRLGESKLEIALIEALASAKAEIPVYYGTP